MLEVKDLPASSPRSAKPPPAKNEESESDRTNGHSDVLTRNCAHLWEEVTTLVFEIRVSRCPPEDPYGILW